MAEVMVKFRRIGVGNGLHGKGCISRWDGCHDFVDRDGVKVGRLKDVDLLSHFIYSTASSNIDGKNEQDAKPSVELAAGPFFSLFSFVTMHFKSHLPHRGIKRHQSKNIPFFRYPTPRDSRSINPSPPTVFYEEECEPRY